MSATCSQVCPVWGYSQEMLGPIGFDKHPNNCGPTVPPHGLLCKVAFSLLASLDIARRTHWSNIWRVMFIWSGSLCRYDMSDLWKWQVYSNLEFKFVYRELVVLCLSLFFWILTWASSKWTWIHDHAILRPGLQPWNSCMAGPGVASAYHKRSLGRNPRKLVRWNLKLLWKSS